MQVTERPIDGLGEALPSFPGDGWVITDGECH